MTLRLRCCASRPAGGSDVYWQERQIIESAVGIAALKAGLIENPGTCVAVLSGGNIDMTLHNRLINGKTVDLPG